MTVNQIVRCPVCGRYKKHGVWLDIKKDVEQLIIAQNMRIVEVQCIDCIQGKYRPTDLWNLDIRLRKFETNYLFNYKFIYSCLIAIFFIEIIAIVIKNLW